MIAFCICYFFNVHVAIDRGLELIVEMTMEEVICIPNYRIQNITYSGEMLTYEIGKIQVLERMTHQLVLTVL